MRAWLNGTITYRRGELIAWMVATMVFSKLLERLFMWATGF
ncbi:MAG TPA: hypothetical protein VD978_19415 [Azospirillum sp.]|nr:hypothetical protein [Azospirillum sp.]